MADSSDMTLPVWTLSTQSDVQLPNVTLDDAMSPQRLTELRTVLAAFADAPLVTLEARPLPAKVDRSRGIALDVASPLASQLSYLVSTTPMVSSLAKVGSKGEVLYRMVVPSKVAAKLGSGVFKQMPSSAVPGGVHSAIRSSSGIAAQATFVPVKAGAGAAGAVGAGAVTTGIITAAAPFVLMSLAVAASAHAEQQRQKAIERITELLEKLENDAIEEERSELEGCRDAIDKATAVLLDQGTVGASLGLDSAVHAIGTALQRSSRRAAKWTASLNDLGEGPVDQDELVKAFPGIDADGGEFEAHLELAALAIALRRRVIVLQAVEHSQTDPENAFESFVRSLKVDQQRVDALEQEIATVLRRLATLELRSPRKLKDTLMTRGEVGELLQTAYRLRDLGNAVQMTGVPGDVIIDIVKDADGSLVVLPEPAE